jgi:hypothetical protein
VAAVPEELAETDWAEVATAAQVALGYRSVLAELQHIMLVVVAVVHIIQQLHLEWVV